MSKSGGNYTYLSWKIMAQLIFFKKNSLFFVLNLRYSMTTCCCQIMDKFTVHSHCQANIALKTTPFPSCKPESISIIPLREENELIMFLLMKWLTKEY